MDQQCRCPGLSGRAAVARSRESETEQGVPRKAGVFFMQGARSGEGEKKGFCIAGWAIQELRAQAG